MPKVNQEIAALQGAYIKARDGGVSTLTEFVKAAAAMLAELGTAIQSEAQDTALGNDFRTLAVGFLAMAEQAMAYANVGRVQEAGLVLMYPPREAAGRWPGGNPPEWLTSSTMKGAPLPGALKTYATQRTMEFIQAGLTPPDSVYPELVKTYGVYLISPGLPAMLDIAGYDSLEEAYVDVHGTLEAVTRPWWSNPVVLIGGAVLVAYGVGRFS